MSRYLYRSGADSPALRNPAPMKYVFYVEKKQPPFLPITPTAPEYDSTIAVDAVGGVMRNVGGSAMVLLNGKVPAWERLVRPPHLPDVRVPHVVHPVRFEAHACFYTKTLAGETKPTRAMQMRANYCCIAEPSAAEHNGPEQI